MYRNRRRRDINGIDWAQCIAVVSPLSNLLCDDGLNNVDGIRQTDMLADWYIIGIGKKRP
jgi:hypothetical protein